jgi:hypothetical protein
MSTHAHSPRQETIGRPPYVVRRCIALTNPPATRKNIKHADGRWGVEWIEHASEQCRMGASPWLPEADYCATHVPADAVLVVRQRMETWGALQADIWAQTLAEHPYTP